MNGQEPGDKLVIGQQAAEQDTITSDDDCETVLSSIDGDINDALNELEEKNYQTALEAVNNAQEAINNAHAYLSGKVE
jgi:hypothetical protein